MLQGKEIGTLIEVKELTLIRNGKRLLNGVSFRLYNGTIYGVTGEGARELLAVLAGTLGYTGGTVNLNGFDLQREPTRARMGTGFLPADPGFFGDMTVFELLREAAAFRGLTEPQRSRAVHSVIEAVRLDGFETVAIRSLGSPQKCRLGLAQASIGGTDRRFLVDPVAGLSPAEAQDFWEALDDLRGNSTVVIASDNEETLSHCGELFRLSEGRIAEAQESPPEAEEPAEEKTFAAPSDVRLSIVAKGDRNAIFEALGSIGSIVSCRPGVPDAEGNLPLSLSAGNTDPDTLTAAICTAFAGAGLRLISVEGKEKTV